MHSHSGVYTPPDRITAFSLGFSHETGIAAVTHGTTRERIRQRRAKGNTPTHIYTYKQTHTNTHALDMNIGTI